MNSICISFPSPRWRMPSMRSSAQPMEAEMGQNWIWQNGAKMNNEVADAIEDRRLFIVYLNEDEGLHDGPHVRLVTFDPRPQLYPWVASFWRRSCAHRSGTCDCRCSIVPQQPLHLFAWDFKPGLSNPRRKGQVIHHKNQDKHDARWKNLGKGTRSAHRRAHNTRRQKFSHRKRDNLGGFYKPQQPSAVKSPPELIGMVVVAEPSTPRPLSIRQRLNAMESRLAIMWERLSAELFYRDSGLPIPRRAPAAAWRAPSTRRLGLYMPTLEPSPGEAVFVLLLVKHGFDMDRASAEAAEDRELLELLWRRPAVSQALENWRDVKRLPLCR